MLRQYWHLLSGGASRSFTTSKIIPSHDARPHLRACLGDFSCRRTISHDCTTPPPSKPDTQQSSSQSFEETHEQLPAITKYDTPYLSSIAHWTPPNEYYKTLLYGNGWRDSYTSANLRRNLIKWIESGPPPLSTYRLAFGKHRGKLLEEVPASYLVKYLIPTKGNSGDCPIVEMAVDDFLRRHPDVKSQAGREKTKPLGEGILKPHVEVRKRREPPKKVVTKVQSPRARKGESVDELARKFVNRTEE
jgi:hypothetical protein